MTSTRAREAFDLSKEPMKVRERYGDASLRRQSCLLARRLVEAGVRFVTVNTFLTVFDEITWDIHGSKPFTSIEGMRDIVALPIPGYQGYSALLEDLFQRGMLDDTMVACLAEFGRTPKVNPAGGRDHWPQCWTVSFAGGGVKGGRVVGKSDEIGGYPAERPVKPSGEVVADHFSAGLGLNLDTHLPGPQSRPLRPGGFRHATDQRVILNEGLPGFSFDFPSARSLRIGRGPIANSAGEHGPQWSGSPSEIAGRNVARQKIRG